MRQIGLRRELDVRVLRRDGGLRKRILADRRDGLEHRAPSPPRPRLHRPGPGTQRPAPRRWSRARPRSGRRSSTTRGRRLRRPHRSAHPEAAAAGNRIRRRLGAVLATRPQAGAVVWLPRAAARRPRTPAGREQREVAPPGTARTPSPPRRSAFSPRPARPPRPRRTATGARHQPPARRGWPARARAAGHAAGP